MSINYSSSFYQNLAAVEKRHFWFNARNSMIRMLNAKYIHVPLGKRFLEVGCGTGIVLDEIVKLGYDTTGIDINAKALEYSNYTGAKLIQKSLFSYVSPVGYDAIGMFDVLEHIGKDVMFLKKAYSRMNKGGLLFLTVPAGVYFWSEIDTISGHKRRYDKASLTRVVEHAGFTIVFLNYWNCSLLPIYRLWRNKKYKINANMVREYVAVPAKLINWILLQILTIEAWCMMRIRMPKGATLVAVARKV